MVEMLIVKATFLKEILEELNECVAIKTLLNANRSFIDIWHYWNDQMDRKDGIRLSNKLLSR